MLLVAGNSSPTEGIEMGLERSQQTNLFEVPEVPATLRASAVDLIKVLLAEALAGPARQLPTVAPAQDGIAREAGNDQDQI